jgi:metal-responsive CopG/Arc/MetJ family transcriptional regulator
MKKVNSCNISIYLPIEIINEIDKKAETEKSSRNAVIVNAIKQLLNLYGQEEIR